MAPISNAPVKQEGGGYEVSSRAAPLMGLNETSNMNTDDAMTCQSIEVFEANPTEPSYAELRSQFPSLADGHIGIRCIHCASHSASPQGKDAIVFPSSMESMAEDVRKLSAKHLGNCAMAPASTREMHQQAAEKRSRNDQERGSSWQDDERSLFALKDWCHMFCQRQKIVDKEPSGSGLEFMQHAVGPPGYGSQDSGMVARVGKRPGTMAADPQAETPSSRRPHDYRAAMPVGAYEGYGQSSSECYYTNPDGSHEGSHGMPAGQQHQGGSPRRGYQQPMPPVDSHENFPFFQEANGCWSCKYCCHVPPPYRQPQSMWGAPNHMPPPPQYMDQHLSMCRPYHQSMSSQQMYQGDTPQGQYPFMVQEFPVSTQQGVWEGTASASQSGQGQPMPYHPQSNLETPPPGVQLSSRSSYPQSPHQMAGASSNLSHGMMPQSRTPPTSARMSDASDAAVQHAIDFLSAADRDTPFTPGVHNTEGPLVLEEDKLLLTDYFFHLMRQLRLCRFSEADRKTRGGKREKILIGFGGLQCIHCSEANNSRKFFWSNVDRLANSFAEIPGHVLKCRHCPQQTKDALFQLKQLHPEQMARLPRGSQKVFFRRMWRRLHDKDPQADSPEQASPPQSSSIATQDEPIAIQTKGSGHDSSPGGTTGSDESILVVQRSTKEAAKALADASAMSFPPSPTSRVLLAIPEDKEWLSDMDVFIRRQIEVFCSTSDDVNVARSDRKFPVHEGQVGIRCIHCSLTKQGTGARGSAVAYPFSVSGIYESVREFQRLHLDSCENLPVELKAKLSDMKGSTSLSSVLRKYYVLAAKALGLQDTRDGIRAGAGSVPIGSESAFAFSSSNSAISDEMRRSTMSSFADSSAPPDSRKRKQDSPEGSGSRKRSQLDS